MSAHAKRTSTLKGFNWLVSSLSVSGKVDLSLEWKIFVVNFCYLATKVDKN